jgi:hypothetical protein
LGLHPEIRDALPPGEVEGGCYECTLRRGKEEADQLTHLLDHHGAAYELTESRRFLPKEILEAAALRLHPSATVRTLFLEGQSSAFDGGCPVCDRGSEQVAEIVLEPTLSERHGLSITTHGDIIVNEAIARALIAEGISGCLLRSTRGPTGEIPGVFQILPTHTLRPLVTPPTRIVERDTWECCFCGSGGQQVQSLLYSDASSSDLLDFNVTEKRFVQPGGIRPELVVSQRLYRLFAQCGVTAMAIEPVILV